MAFVLWQSSRSCFLGPEGNFIIANAIETLREALMRRTFFQFVILGLLLAPPAGVVLRAQDQTPPPAKPPSTQQDQKQTPAKPADQPQSTTPATPADPTYDPFHAEQDIEVGMFYMHKGDVDAAITRFEHAILMRANLGKPRLLLAECYEKKHEPSTALKYYKEYLKVYPDAPDRKAVEKKIEKLSIK
jgi:tetratricopeptide (TPR) repeat protein